MMITIGTIRRWQPTVLEEAVRTLLRQRDALTSLQDEVSGSMPPASWRGDAADQAAIAHRNIDEAVQRLTGEVASVWAAALDAADSLAALRGALTEAENLAHHHDFTIADDGTIAGRMDLAKPDTDRRAVELELRYRIAELQRKAIDIDGKMARVLGNAHDDLLRTKGTLQAAAHAGAQAGVSEVTPPPKTNTAGANATWWKSLSPAEQNMVLATKPDWVGNLDGAPAWARNQANRTRMGHMRDQLRHELNALPPEDPRAAIVQEKLKAIGAIEAELRLGEKEQGPLNPALGMQQWAPRQLLLLDLSGDFPKAAVSVGDVDHAERVAVQTPGIRSSVSESLAGNQAEMAALHHDSNGKVAAISWIGYEPPQDDDVIQTVYDIKARAGAEDLARFYQGINASRGDLPDPNLTALGHSYGGVTTEHALTREGTGVDAAAVYGTPGHAVDDVNKLHVPQDSFYTLTSDVTMNTSPPGEVEPLPSGIGSPGGDVWEQVGDKGGDLWREIGPKFGYDVDDAGLRGDIDGDQELSADPHEHSRGVRGHTDYMNPETTSYNNVLDVTTGNTDELVRREI